jgi:hypothetical protein
MHAQHVLVRLADGNEYRIRYDMNALADYEQATGKPITSIAEGQPGVREVRALLWAGLRHQFPRMAIEQAGRLIPNDAEGLGDIAEACARAVAICFGKPDAAGRDASGEAVSPIQKQP